MKPEDPALLVRNIGLRIVETRIARGWTHQRHRDWTRAALPLPFAAAATTVSSVASADPLPAAQAENSAPEAHRVGEGKRGEHAKGEHRKGGHSRAEHGKGHEHRRGDHAKKKGPGPRENGPARPN